MPRRPRINLAGHPQDVVQRGHNREACFFADEDYLFYLHWLREGAKKYGCDVHAYALMTNHVHLLLTPQRPDAISRLMQSLCRIKRSANTLPLKGAGSNHPPATLTRIFHKAVFAGARLAGRFPA